MVSDSMIQTEVLEGYLSIPDNEKGQGILLVHAWWGLNEFFKALATRFAVEGFVTFAPDYYDGQVAATVSEGKHLSKKLDRKRAHVTLRSALDYLKQNSSLVGEKIGVVGFSLGTRFSINLARKRLDDVGAVVLFYGVTGGKFDWFRVPIQGHFAENDKWGAGPKAVKKFEARLAQGDQPYELHTYPSTTHWFLEEDVTDAYHRPSAELAFRRTITFLKSHL